MLNNLLAERVVETLARHKDLDILVSDAIVTTAAGVVEAIDIPASSYVYRVALYNPGASDIERGDIDVGDGDSSDRYIDGLTGLAAKDIAVAPVAGADVASDEVAGHYYASADTIDVDVNGTAAGSVKVMAWYVVI